MGQRHSTTTVPKMDIELQPIASMDVIEVGKSYRRHDDITSSSSETTTVKQTLLQRVKTIVVYLGLGSAIASSAVAIAIFQSSLATMIMGVVSIVNAPIAACKERRLGKIQTLRTSTIQIRQEVNTLIDEGNLLSEEIQALQPEAERLAKEEQEFKAIAKAQGINMNSMIELVKEHEAILSDMRDNLRRIIVQDMIRIVVNSDRDNTQTISPKEGKLLAMQIDVALREHGVQFNQDKFARAIEGTKDRAIHVIMEIAKKLLLPLMMDDGMEKKKVMKNNTNYNNRGMTMSGTYYESDDGNESDLDDDYDYTTNSRDDVYDMFYIAENDVRISNLTVSSMEKEAVGSLLSGLQQGSSVSLIKCDKEKRRRRSRSKNMIKKAARKGKKKGQSAIAKGKNKLSSPSSSAAEKYPFFTIT